MNSLDKEQGIPSIHQSWVTKLTCATTAQDCRILWIFLVHPWVDSCRGNFLMMLALDEWSGFSLDLHWGRSNGLVTLQRSMVVRFETSMHICLDKMLPSNGELGNNRRLTYQSNSHQFSELLECVQVDLDMFKILGFRNSDFISQLKTPQFVLLTWLTCPN